MKKNKLILGLLIVAASATAMAKPRVVKGGGSDSKFSVGVAVGAGIPMGDFSKAEGKPTTPDTTKVYGYAKTGFHFNVNASYMFTDNVGAMLLIGGNIQGYDADTKKSDDTPTGFTNPNTYSATSYYVGQYLLGPTFCFPVNDMFSFDARVLVGLMTVSYSTLSITPASGGASTQAIASTSAFAYGGGIGGKYKINDMVGIRLGLDYIGSSQTVKSGTFTPASGTATTFSTSRAMSTSLLNISVGAAFSF